MNYHIVTLGCQMNKSDSERVNTVIEKMGYRWTNDEEDADLLGVIACSVRQKAIDKVYSRIHKWNALKNKKNLVTFITGCVLPADREKFLKLFDIIFQISDLTRFHEMISQYGIVTPYSLQRQNDIADTTLKKQSINIDFQIIQGDLHKKTIAGPPVMMKKAEKRISGFWNVEPHYQSDFEAFIPIQNGCDKFCSFCAVPYTRGREISRPSDEIIAEFKKLVAKGYKSITLLGQNVNSYGLDRSGEELSFPSLLRKIGELGDNSRRNIWVYFTSPHPCDMSDEVLEVIAQHKCLAKQIHLPLQSGDDEVLKRMNRNYTLAEYRKKINSIKKFLPGSTLFTDIIVGFTSETDEQFLNTLKAMEEFKFNMAYIARYSPRTGSKSSQWNDDVPNTTKKQRLHELSVLLQEHSLFNNSEMKGKTYKVLVTGNDRKEGFLTGLTEGRIIVRFATSDKTLIGSFIEVKITSAADFAVEGELVRVLKEEKAEA